MNTITKTEYKELPLSETEQEIIKKFEKQFDYLLEQFLKSEAKQQIDIKNVNISLCVLVTFITIIIISSFIYFLLKF